MSLFDSLKEKAAELLGGAGDKVGELTGVDLSGAADQVTQATGGLAETGQGLSESATTAGQDAVDSATAAGQGVVDSTGAFGDAATGLAGDVIDPNARG
ncbi:hypothetical protein [Amycolatopsis japonica]